SASVLDGTEIVYIARASQMRVMSINLMAGSRLPAYCASMGRVLLAWLYEPEAQALLERTERKALTPFTKVEIRPLMAELSIIRGQGYAINDQELELGLRSIAVPIFNHKGLVAAALNIGVPVAHLEASDLVERLLPAMLRVQSDL